MDEPIRSQTSETTFGNTTYIVTTTFNEQARETVEQKFIHYVADKIANETNTPKTQQTNGQMADSWT
jgi:hypothetical protein